LKSVSYQPAPFSRNAAAETKKPTKDSTASKPSAA
jgi:hypothetical protein